MEPHPAWTRMRPKTDANIAQLKELVRQQSLWEISRQIGASEQFDYATLDDIKENYRSSSNSLEQLLEFPDYQQANNSDVVTFFSVYVISRNPIFPPESRRNAYKTFLPNDLPKQL